MLLKLSLKDKYRKERICNNKLFKVLMSYKSAKYKKMNLIKSKITLNKKISY